MTITDTGRRTRDQLLAEAREAYAGQPLPSRTALSKALGCHFTTASEVREDLARERRREAARAVKAQRAEDRTQVPAWRVTRSAVISSAPPFTTPSGPAAVEVAEPVADTAPEGVEQVADERLVEDVPQPRRRPKSWLLVGVMVSASVAIWGGWVDLGRLTGFGVVHPFPGIPKLDALTVNLAITLPVGLEAYAAYALSVWLSAYVPAPARRFARWSAIFSLALGFAGQATYHLMIAAGWTQAPWWITLLVSGVPVGVAGLAATLRHLVHAEEA